MDFDFLKFIISKLLFYMNGCFAYIAVFTMCMSGPLEARWHWDPPELELQTVVSHHVGPGN